MAHVLSPSEVESLLAGPAAESGIVSSNRNAAVSRQVAGLPRRRLGPESLRALLTRHSRFAQEFGTALSELLRAAVEVRPLTADQLTFREYVLGLENPTSLHLVHSQALGGGFLLELSAAIVFPFVERLLGGGHPAMTIPRRPLTNIELRLVARFTGLALAPLRSTWADVCDLDLRVTPIEQGLEQAEIAAPDDEVAQISHEIGMGEVHGLLNVCYRVNGLLPLAGKLPVRATPNHPGAVERAGGPPRATAGIDLVASLAATTLPANDVASLAVGDVICTDCRHDRPLTVVVDCGPRFTAFAGMLQGRRAVRLGRRLDESTAPKAGMAGDLR